MSKLNILATALLLGTAAAGGEAAAPGAVQVWNAAPWQTVAVGDFTGTNPEMKALKPIELLGTRNGVCSGFVVVTREGAALKGLKASAGELSQAGGGKGRVAAERIQVRFADLARAQTSHMPAHRFDRLLDQAPPEVPAVAPGVVKAFKKDFAPKSTTPVATAPVWVTVRVPADALPGEYEGKLSVEAEGLPATAVPVKLKVHDWVLPAPKDFRVRTIGWMNPEALAKHYEVKLWSEEHFKLMGRSMELMLELGSRHIQIDVTQYYPSRDNADTMIKWVRQADGSYKYDFTVFDKYCDLAAAKLGKPFPVRLNMWKGPRNGGGGETDNYPNTRVLVLDPASGAVSELEGPKKLGSEEMKAFWKPVMDEIRVRLEKRGWMDVAGPNWMCYCGGMTKELASMVKSIWPDGKWLDVTHSRQLKYPTLDGGFAPVFVSSTVWSEGTFDAYVKWKSGPYPRQYANKFDPATAVCSHARVQWREADWPALWTLRTKHEDVILKGNDGVECVGIDHFPIKDPKGRWRGGDWSAFAQGPNNGMLAVLGAGDTGPIGSERFEAMREGIQLCEAMVFIQKAVEAKKLAGNLEARANKVLDDRARAMTACLKPTGYRGGVYVDLDEYAKAARERDDLLYATAAEVARATAGK
ncbi:MAG TPA: hypothetical protein PK280_01850 [Planctomycetota bacterium]|nr:hypothetical protein [Planctomycetota bacterium]